MFDSTVINKIGAWAMVFTKNNALALEPRYANIVLGRDFLVYVGRATEDLPDELYQSVVGPDRRVLKMGYEDIAFQNGTRIVLNMDSWYGRGLFPKFKFGYYSWYLPVFDLNRYYIIDSSEQKEILMDFATLGEAKNFVKWYANQLKSTDYVDLSEYVISINKEP